MQILKTSSIKKKFINNEKNLLEMKLINEKRIIENVSKNIIDIIKNPFEETKSKGFCICETEYD